MEEIKSCLDSLVELARAEFGERQTKLVGYNAWNFYGNCEESEEIKSIEELMTYEEITSQDIENIKNLFMEDQFYCCEDGKTAIRCVHGVINKGWRQELIGMLVTYREDSV